MMQKCSNNRGSISIFLCLVMSVQFMAFIVLMNFALTEIGEKEIRQAAQLSAHGILSRFDPDLFRHFGVFALSDASEGEALFQENFSKANDDASFITPRLQEFSVKPVERKVLANPDVLLTQIRAMMEWQVPGMVIKEIMDKAGVLQQFRESASVLRKQLAFEEKMDAIQDQMEGAVTLFRRLEKEKSFKGAQDLSVPLEKMTNELKETKDFEKAREIYTKELRRLSETQFVLKSVLQHLKEMQNEKIHAEDARFEWREAMQSLPEGMIKERFSLTYLSSPSSDTKKWEEFAKKLEKIQLVTEKQLDAWKALSLNGKEFAKLNSDTWKELGSSSTFQKDEGLQVFELFDEKEEAVKEELYNTTKEGRSGLLEAFQAWNTKRAAISEARRLAKDKGAILSKTLSSLGISPDQEARFLAYAANSVKDFPPIIEGSDPAQILGALKEQGAFKSFEGPKDQIALLSYIFTQFSCRTTPFREEHTSMLGEDLALRKAYRGEMEYLIAGHDNLGTNQRIVMAMIAGMRLGANLFTAFTSAELSREATAVALGLAGWTGFGVPIVRSGLLAVMALGETRLDTKALAEGKSVPVLKSGKSWRFSLSGIKPMIEGAIGEAAERGKDEVLAGLEAGSELAKEAKNRALDLARDELQNTADKAIEGVLFSGKSDVESLKETFQTILSQGGMTENADGLFQSVMELVQEKHTTGGITDSLLNKAKDLSDGYVDTLSDSVQKKADTLFSHFISEKEESQEKGEVESSALFSFTYEDYLKILLVMQTLKDEGLRSVVSRMARLMHIEAASDLTLAPTKIVIDATGLIKLFGEKTAPLTVHWEEGYEKKKR